MEMDLLGDLLTQTLRFLARRLFLCQSKNVPVAEVVVAVWMTGYAALELADELAAGDAGGAEMICSVTSVSRPRNFFALIVKVLGPVAESNTGFCHVPSGAITTSSPFK